MKAIVFAALSILVNCSMSAGGALAASGPTEVIRFAAATVVDGQGARAVISNVTASAQDSTESCHVQVVFFGSDGSVIHKAEQSLKAGASASIVAQGARALVRASISIVSGIEASKHCHLLARLEIYDLNTGTTFISIAPESVDSAGEPSVTSSISSQKVLNRGTKRPFPRIRVPRAVQQARPEGLPGRE